METWCEFVKEPDSKNATKYNFHKTNSIAYCSVRLQLYKCALRFTQDKLATGAQIEKHKLATKNILHG